MKLFTAIIIILLAVFPAMAGGESESQPDNKMRMEPVMEEKNENGKMEGAMEGAMMSGGSMGPLIDFVDMDDAENLAELGPTVLFFAAEWCPSCRSARADFEANSMELEDIALLVVDYDNSRDLQKRFGVTYQHTFVQIDPEGNAITKWNGGGTSQLLDELVKEEM